MTNNDPTRGVDLDRQLHKSILKRIDDAPNDLFQTYIDQRAVVRSVKDKE